ncbi:UDP-glucose dehydrogenase family protein [Vulgatibacter incomptus]|uniref:UDP-glucose 6-dehydrogenase n=1 Tax=Vulgatibacter incomptus TaxID=1391653 RepID=A0A0K1PGL5_9BACT|nr:UDP-glucose/GDP-mannose dehydrogenase family protein [Vulgatibacter incomptus]AKU92239.1 UDP-glucose dehydrogenase [Vulgatibacter incomptus]
MRVAVIGTGYVGLVAGTCFADSGNDVVCVDIDGAKIDALRRGEIPIYEPGLEELVERNAAAGRLTFTTRLPDAVSRAEVVFIAVGTPQGDDGSADLQYVLAAARAIGRSLGSYTVVVDKSTVPVGTAKKVREEILSVAPNADFDVVSNPEFMKEGAAIDDFLSPDRVVIGTESQRARDLMAELYAPFTRRSNRILFMDPQSAELTKYAANAMLAARISFMNEMAALCEKVGADVDHVRLGLGSDSRIGLSFLFPGPGFGGSCFPKDIRALYSTARENGLDFNLLGSVDRVNEQQKQLLLRKAIRHFGGNLSGKHFGVWGLAFKPKTDDMRESPSIPLIEGLLGKGATVAAHDPVAHGTAKRIFGDRIGFTDTPYGAVEGADGLFIVTEWNEFRRPDFDRLKGLMKAPVIFDGRNVFDPARMRDRGFVYEGIGRGVAP